MQMPLHGAGAVVAARTAATRCGLGFARLSPLVPLVLLYLACLPSTVQDLDTGELVANAWQLAVVHPPGMPLFIWLQHGVTHLVPWGSVFWRACLSNVGLAGVTLACILWLACADSSEAEPGDAVGAPAWAAWSLVLAPLALSRLFWGYTVRPDVFMANGCILALLLAGHLFGPVGPRRALGLSLGLALGAGFHQSIVFAAPLVLHAHWEARAWRTAGASALGAAAILAASHLSLLWMHPDAADAWGQLQTTGDVLDHLLRRAYGTLQLDGHGTASPWGRNLLALGRALWTSMPIALGLALAPLLPGAGWTSMSAPAWRRYVLAWGTCLAYVLVFFALANADSPRVLERFFLFPMVMLAGLAAASLRALRPSRRRLLLPLGLAASLLSLSHLPQALEENQLAQDTIIEDYARNLLEMLPADGRSVLLVDGDSRIYALRYVQSVLQVRPDVLVLNLGDLFTGPRQAKVLRQRPGLVIDRPPPGSARSLDPIAHLVRRNSPGQRFYAAGTVAAPGLRQIHMGLGRRLSLGAEADGVDLASAARLHWRTEADVLAPTEAISERSILFAEYAYVHLKAAELADGSLAVAEQLQQAVDRVPYCYVALRDLCRLRARDAAEQRACLQAVDLQQAGAPDLFTSSQVPG